ncbi:MAG: adenylyltransferase/cytidyltransferase family protein [Candidatus Acidiferrales bacterium]
MLRGDEPGDAELGKVVSQDELILYRAEWKRNGERVVLASGCFDLLHPGHVRLLEQARALADVLVVGVQSDREARAAFASGAATNKNLARPITPVAERMEILAALAAVGYVFEFDAATARDLIDRLQPEVVVEGGGDTDPAFTDRSKVAAAGPRIVHIPLEPGFSTSRLIDRITKLTA